MFRGGSWHDRARDCQSARRYRHWPVNRGDHIGLRVSLVPADAGARNPNGGMPMPTDGANEHLENNGKLDLDTAHWTVPKAWIHKPPKSMMLQAEYGIPAVTGDKDGGRLTISRAGGTVEDNIARWKGQFSKKLDKESRETIDAGGVKITLVDLTGTFDDARA